MGLGRTLTDHLKDAEIKLTAADYALVDRQLRAEENTYDEKIKVVENLVGRDIKIDFAGGDPLACYENYLIIKRVASLFGRESVSLTATGAGLTRYNLKDIAATIGQFEFTFDEPLLNTPDTRPKSYNRSNLKLASAFGREGVFTKAQLPIHRGNSSSEAVETIYQSLVECKIDELLLMRVFPVGRGVGKDDLWKMEADEYRRVIDQYIRLSAANNKPKVRLQCALKNLYTTNKSGTNPCDAIRQSFGINWRGELLVSAWANKNGGVLDDSFRLGSLVHNRFDEIITNERTTKYRKMLDDNFGQCKVFAFLNSKHKDVAAMFDTTDPLYNV